MTNDRRGISCDLCGAEIRDRFDYYSFKIDKVVVDSAQNKQGVVDVDRRYMDVDACPKCMDDIADRMKKVIVERSNKATKSKKNKADEWRK